MFKNINLQRLYLLILAFTSGFTIMGIELAASRLIAPYFGTSTFIWTNIIGVIMIALAIGYYLGGKQADKRPDLKILLSIIILACILLLLVPFVAKPLVEVITSLLIIVKQASIIIFFGSLISIALLFLAPIVLLGMVSPFIIKLLSVDDKHIGNDAGLVFCISTVGSILGTFLPVLVLIPTIGTRKTIIIFALILLLVSLFGLLKKKAYLGLVCLAFVLAFLNLPQIKNVNGAIFEGESVYQYFQVVDSENMRSLLINEGMGLFSAINKNKEEVLTGMYFDNYNLLPYLDGNSKKQDILILGLAAGTISTQLDALFVKDYDLQIDGVEIDSKLIEVGKDYFDMANPSLNIYNLDGRNFLEYYTDKKYNAIVLDVYANQLYIPFHLTTKEFFLLTQQHLQTNGILAMNVNAVDDQAKLLKNITNTMLLVYKNVYLVKDLYEDWNYLVLASDTEIDFQKLQDINHELLNPVISNAIEKNTAVSYDNNFSYLTDDRAPVENLTDWMILDYLYK